MDLIKYLSIFENNPYVSVILYREKIIYANNTFCNLMGLSKEEIVKLAPEEIFVDKELRPKIRETINRRLKGEVFHTPYPPLQIVSNNKRRIYIKFTSQTVKYENKYAGLALALDVSLDVQKSYYIDILKEINQTIITKENEDEIFTNIVNAIKKKGRYQFVCAAVKEENGSSLIPKYCVGEYDDEFYEFLKSIFKADEKYADKCMATKYMLENKFMIVNDIREVDFPNKKLLDMLQRQNCYSLLFFPIYKNGKLYATIGICSGYVNDFDKYALAIFDEAKHDMEYALEKSDEISYLRLIKEALDKSYSCVVITDEHNNILYANKIVKEKSGYSPEELIGKNPRVFKSGIHPISFYKELWDKLKRNEVVETDFINKRKDKSLLFVKKKIIPLVSSNGKKYYISLGMDITNEKELKNKLKIDALTDLYNREEFINVVSSKVKGSNKYACIVIDLKDFKIFNQLNGNAAGDMVLTKIAGCLKKILSPNDFMGRIGGDEFAICTEYESINEIYSLINNLIFKIKNLKEMQNRLSVNIGVSLYPKDSTNVMELMEKAYLALEMAKNEGDFTYKFFDENIKDKIIEYYDVKELLINGIKRKSFIYHFQPYVDAESFKVVGAETLLRLEYEGKIIYPNVFIDFAENSGYIKEIEKIMFPQYLKYLKEAGIPLSFNISGKSLTDEEHIKNLFKNAQNKPVVIELTEREIAGNIEYTKKIFEFFKSKGFKLSIDDFGTGYSSLTYLKELPADYLKVDMSFIKNIENSKKDLAVVETIIDFAHKLGLVTIVEGVETEGQVEILRNIGADYLQGYYFAKPMCFNDLKVFIKKHS